MVDLTPFVLPVRVVQFIFSIIVIGTEGYGTFSLFPKASFPNSPSSK